jgi:hypothetical protein
VFSPFYFHVEINGDLLVAHFLLVICLAYSLNLKIKAECSSEKSLHFFQTTGRHFTEESYRCENLRPNNITASTSSSNRPACVSTCSSALFYVQSVPYKMQLKWLSRSTVNGKVVE